jgi:hypothetical protein
MDTRDALLALNNIHKQIMYIARRAYLGLEWGSLSVLFIGDTKTETGSQKSWAAVSPKPHAK